MDAAFGGFVIPFLKELPAEVHFAVPGVSSIAIDPHKMGMSTIPAGGLLFRGWQCLDALETRRIISQGKASICTAQRETSCGSYLRRDDASQTRRDSRSSVLIDLTHDLSRRSGGSRHPAAIKPIMMWWTSRFPVQQDPRGTDGAGFRQLFHQPPAWRPCDSF